jgi:cytochrome c oxidase cbb3-type subunit I/II
MANRADSIHGRLQTLYTPLELAGRDLYVSEGCYNCHSQQIRMLVPDVLRYGRPGVTDDYSHLGESLYDHPFQWGSKRTGPDLHRLGGKYPNLWHYTHLMDPRATSQGSNMPSYRWLADAKIDQDLGAKKLDLMTTLGVPYTPEQIANAKADQQLQGEAIAKDLASQSVTVAADSEIVAMISYLQRLGRDHGVRYGAEPVKTTEVVPPPAPAPTEALAPEGPANGGGR